MFVGGHTYPVACTAEGNAKVVLPFLYGFRKGVGIVGVVATIGRETTKVVRCSAFVL